MNHSEEELIELVGELTDKYTGKESTSITYEKANQLMEAILYCIHAYEEYMAGNEEFYLSNEEMTAKVAYELGYEKVLWKVKKTKEMYNQMMVDFKSYKNRCYCDTFVKGIPAFFLYYDPRFQPQNHILTLDYPILTSLETMCGADAIHEYVRSVRLEQMFLRKIPEVYILHVLRAYDSEYEELFINLASIVLRNLLGCRIAGKVVQARGYTDLEVGRVKDYVNQNTRESLEKELKEAVDEIILFGYEGNQELGDYLKADMHDFSFELKNGIKNQCLEVVLATKN